MKIIHIIDSLAIGGAEQLLSGVIQSTDQFDHTVVYLNGQNDYVEELSRASLYCLNYENRFNTFAAVLKLKQIFDTIQPDIIHSHLPTATYLTRLANYNKCKIYFTVHNCLSKSSFKKSKLTWLLEKILYKKNHHALFVSEAVKEDYDNEIGIKGEYSILYNFVENVFFEHYKERNFDYGNKPLLKFVSIGTLKEQKNHSFLIDNFTKLSSYEYTLDIIGAGPQKMFLIDKINKLGASNISLRMGVRDLQQELGAYDFFILASKYEGFGIAPVEAMATGLPLVLADINVFQEVTNGNASFFDIDKPDTLLNFLHSIPEKSAEIKKKCDNGRVWAIKQFTKRNYISKLLAIYSETHGK